MQPLQARSSRVASKHAPSGKASKYQTASAVALIPRSAQGSQVSPRTITGPHKEAKAPARSALLGKASKYPAQLTSAPLREARQQKDPRVAALLCLKQVSPSIRRLLAQLTSALLCLKCVRWFLLCSALLGKTSNALHSLSDLLPQHIYIARWG